MEYRMGMDQNMSTVLQLRMTYVECCDTGIVSLYESVVSLDVLLVPSSFG